MAFGESPLEPLFSDSFPFQNKENGVYYTKFSSQQVLPYGHGISCLREK